MKLTAHILRVKQVPQGHLLIASLLTGVGLMLLWSVNRNEDAHIEHFGTTLATSLASQVIEPLIADELIYLGVLTNRINELPEVTGAAIHTLDGNMLALSGDTRGGRRFAQQVVHNGTTIGLVRVHIDETGFDAGMSAWVIVLSLVWMGFAPVLVIAASRVPLPRPGVKPAASAVQVFDETEPEPLRWFTVTVNLFNQLSLAPEQCQKELSFARHKAASVAELYNGKVQDLPGTGLLLSFSATDNDERSFHVLCAAFTLSRLLADAETFGRYRISIHTLLTESDQPPVAQEDAVTDAAVLSALVKDNTIVVSAALFDQVPFAERVEFERMNHPLLEELETIGGGAYLARSLAEPHADLVAQQVAELDYSDRSTASESTF